ncbi:DnaA N-terminal domain-containing protein [Orientia tsutsugamushi]|uniref:DnaA N-terminal domain-containing protein n=1 Tax=Orientia tsutsugamushi TaxID=784 RepID=UPI003529A71E
MRPVVFDFLTNSCTILKKNSNNNDTIFYNFIGNIIPPEWRKLTGDNGKALSKTSKQLLSFIVFRLHIYYNKDIDELQESYQLYEDKLNVCQRRVRQCLVELRDAGFIEIENRTIIKDNLKLRNVPCIKILKNFQHYSEKGKEENIALPEKKFRPNLKEISGQPETFFRDIYRYIKKSKISRSTEGELVENKKNENEEQHFQNVDDFENDIQTSTKNCNQDIKSLITKILKSSNCKKEWFKRYRLEDFYPLTPEDVVALQHKSDRAFNIYFINKLLLKLADQYSNYHFGCKKSVLNYMAKALANELRNTDQANSGNFKFDNVEKFNKEKYLTQIETSTNLSKESQLKHKIAGSFEAAMAYQILTSCSFGPAVRTRFFVKLLKNITLTECDESKILQAVQDVYGYEIQELQVTPFEQLKTVSQKQINEEEYLLNLSKQLGSNSTWYKVRESLIKSYGQAIDKSWFIKLEVINEDNVSKKIFIKAKTEFEDSYIRENYLKDLESAFKAQGFSFELVKFSNFNKI